MEKPILTIGQAAKLLQVDPNTIYRWARAGKFPASKIGKEWRVLRTDVLKFIESHKKRQQFLSESQEAELITALVGRREIPLKFEYLGEGADRYTSLSHPREVGGETELDILLANERKFAQLLEGKNFNLLDLGCGDGKKAAFFISHINKSASAYFALDISSRMLETAVNNMELAHPRLPHETFEDDFEYGNIANVTYYLNRRYQSKNLIIFLGNTIGNLFDAHRVLVNLRESMGDEDFLIVGLAYYNPKNIPVSSYNNPNILEVLWTVPEKIGIKRYDAKIYWSYNKVKRQLECQLEFLKDWRQTFGANFLQFAKGQRIRMAISRRFIKEDIFELFAEAGFRIEFLVHDKDNALILSRPHSWEKKI
ncbi:L-histidine N(alpha)-methyltransferase [Candidatus Woesebacteria bacterium]|nr:L-histidine N(alpha)-methyltransferase [Candidatus Woesebacteria bacterium]